MCSRVHSFCDCCPGRSLRKHESQAKTESTLSSDQTYRFRDPPYDASSVRSHDAFDSYQRFSATSSSAPIIAKHRSTRTHEDLGITSMSRYATVTRVEDSKVRASSVGRLGSNTATYNSSTYPTARRHIPPTRSEFSPSAYRSSVLSSPASNYQDDYRSTSRFGSSIGNSLRSRAHYQSTAKSYSSQR